MLAAACGLLLAGCAGSDLGLGEDARKGGFVTLALDRAPQSLDPALAERPQDQGLLWQAYTPLLTLRRASGAEGTDVVPGLARGLPQLADGGRTLRLELRPGLRYSDGTPVRASDVPHSLRRVRELRSPGARLFAGVQSVEADDRARRVTFRLRRADASFPHVLASTYAAPVPARTPIADQSERPAAGVGPYRLVRRGADAVLVRRRRFRLPEVPGGNVDRVAVTADRNAERRARRTIAGALDATVGALPAKLLPEVRSKYAARYDERPGTTSTMFVLDSRRGPFADVRVRQAANFAVESEAFGRLLDGRLTPGCTILPPAVAGYREPDPCPWGDPREPADLRQAAELVRTADATRRPVTVGGGRGRADRRVVRSFARLLNKLGLRARVDRPGGARPQAALVHLRPALAHPQAYLLSLAPLDRQLARAMRRLRSQADPERAAEGWAALDSNLVQRARVVPLGYDEDATLLSARMDAENCSRPHPVYGVDVSSFCLK